MRELWELGDVELLSSSYVLAEARRNLAEQRRENLPQLDSLIGALTLAMDVETPATAPADLDDKDVPVLAAAIGAGASHLLTGDKAHFRHLFGRTVGGVLILPPGEYLRGRQSPEGKPEDPT